MFYTCVSATKWVQFAERGGKNYGLSYQNLIRKYEDDLEP